MLQNMRKFSVKTTFFKQQEENAPTTDDRNEIWSA